MRTDFITISNNGSRMEEALAQADKVAQYKELSPKAAMHLRLLTEEMLGMMRSITGERTGLFWIEDQDDVYQLHLKVETPMNYIKKEKLLSASSSGKNEAAKGIMGKIRTFFDPLEWENAPVVIHNDGMMPAASWSISAYRDSVKKDLEQEREGAAQAWDELEKSVVSNLANDVRVSISGKMVEMVILKQFANNMK